MGPARGAHAGGQSALDAMVVEQLGGPEDRVAEQLRLVDRIENAGRVEWLRR